MTEPVGNGHSGSKPRAIIVLDVGKTNVKLVAVNDAGRVLTSRVAPNVPVTRAPYMHCDVEHIWRWLMAALADLGERFRIEAIVPTSYGSCAALVDDDGLVMPVMDYEADPPEEIKAAYAEIAPPYGECFCPVLPGGMNLARQLFWQQQAFPLAFERATHVLPFPQYWAWRLCGVACSEVTSIGAHSQLWEPRGRRFSSLVERLGWESKFAPFRSAFEVLGSITDEVVERAELPAETPVLAGIHDSNANYARYLSAGIDDLTLVSSGTWIITFNPATSLDRLDPERDTISNTDLLGRPVPCARFMGGRELELVLDGAAAAAASEQEAVRTVASGTMAMPSFTNSGGPFPGTGNRGHVDGPLALDPEARPALATLYVALVTDTCLGLLESRNRIVIDGAFADNALFAGILAALRPDQTVHVSPERQGTAVGASRLWRWEERSEPAELELMAAEPAEIPGLADYASRWREAAGAAA